MICFYWLHFASVSSVRLSQGRPWDNSQQTFSLVWILVSPIPQNPHRMLDHLFITPCEVIPGSSCPFHPPPVSNQSINCLFIHVNPRTTRDPLKNAQVNKLSDKQLLKKKKLCPVPYISSAEFSPDLYLLCYSSVYMALPSLHHTK